MTEHSEAVVDRFIHIADLHFWHVERNPFRLLNKRALGNFNVWWRRQREFTMTRAEEFADYVASLGIPNLLLTGDFSSTALDSEFALARTFVDRLRDRGMHIALMPGNHDVYTFESVRNKRFERHFHDYLPANGYPSVDRLPGGTPQVLVPTVCANWLSSRGRITEAEISRLRELLTPLKAPVVVAGHYPVLNQTYGYTVSGERSLRNAAALHSALGQANKKLLYVCGHVHRFSYVTDVDYPEVQHLSSGAFFRLDSHLRRHGEFSEIHVTDEGFKVFHHTFEEGWRRESVEPRPAAPIRP